MMSLTDTLGIILALLPARGTSSLPMSWGGQCLCGPRTMPESFRVGIAGDNGMVVMVLVQALKKISNNVHFLLVYYAASMLQD